MQRLEVSGAVRPIYGSLGVKRLIAWVLHGSKYVRFTPPSGFTPVLKASNSHMMGVRYYMAVSMLGSRPTSALPQY